MLSAQHVGELVTVSIGRTGFSIAGPCAILSGIGCKVLLVGMLTWWPFSRQREVQCPDGPKLVYKNADHAFPLQLRNTKASASAAVEALQQMKGKLDVRIDQIISATLVHVDSVNASTQGQLRAAYTVFQSDPCNQSQYLAQAVAQIRHDEQNLRTAEFKVRSLMVLLPNKSKVEKGSRKSGSSKDPPDFPDDGQLRLFSQQLTKVIETLDQPLPSIGISREMAKVSVNTALWKSTNE